MTLCDTGPLVALIDADDPDHERCLQASPSIPPAPMVTTWPCFTEAMHLLHRISGIQAQNELWRYVVDGILRIDLSSEHDWQRMRELMNQYADMPLDLADASLIAAAERLGDRQLFTIDSRLRAVRLHGTKTFELVP